jgi:uncharacterized protein YbjT (DUF2867 family)
LPIVPGNWPNLKGISVKSGRLILVTGVTGYVGGSLVPRLLEKGYRVRMLVRDPKRLAGRVWLPQVELVHGDIFSRSTLDQAMQGVSAAYYFIHAMISGKNYYEKEIESARNFAAVAEGSGVEHIIYLGGLADPEKEIGLHLRSRIQTGDALRQGRVPVTEFRASLIIGSGSISFELIRYLTEQFPVLIGLPWMHNRTQPIAIQNVLDYLVAALEHPDAGGKIYEIGGKDVLTYAGTIYVYARLRGLKRRIVILPGFSVNLMAQIAGKVTPVPARIAGPLLGGMRTDSVVHDDAASRDFPHILPMDYAASVRLALESLSPASFETDWENGASSFRIKQEGFFIEGQHRHIDAQPELVYRIITGLGGWQGWLYLDWLWKLRGLMDRLVGGAGLRGRTSFDEIAEGDILDYYRVEALETNRLVRLRAELKAPGLGWMEWRIHPQSSGDVLLTQIAFFAPKGAFGFLYWNLLQPFHHLVFSGLIRVIARRAVENRNIG